MENKVEVQFLLILRERLMEKIHPSTVHRSFHLEVSARIHIVFRATLLNMLEKQQGQFSRNFSSTRNGYFRGQDQTPKKFIFLEVRGQSQWIDQYQSIDVRWISLIYCSPVAALLSSKKAWAAETNQINLLYHCYLLAWGIFPNLDDLQIFLLNENNLEVWAFL